MPTPYAAGSDIGTKSVPQQKIFFGTVIFDLGGRATMLRGRLHRIGWRKGRHQRSCDKDERLGGRRAAQSPAPSWVPHRATPPGVISLSWRSKREIMQPVNRTRAVIARLETSSFGRPGTGIGRLDISGGEQAQDEQHQENHDENEKENTSDVRARSRNPGKTKNRRHNRNKEKYESPFK